MSNEEIIKKIKSNKRFEGQEIKSMFEMGNKILFIAWPEELQDEESTDSFYTYDPKTSEIKEFSPNMDMKAFQLALKCRLM